MTWEVFSNLHDTKILWFPSLTLGTFCCFCTFGAILACCRAMNGPLLSPRSALLSQAGVPGCTSASFHAYRRVCPRQLLPFEPGEGGLAELALHPGDTLQPAEECLIDWHSLLLCQGWQEPDPALSCEQPCSSHCVCPKKNRVGGSAKHVYTAWKFHLSRKIKVLRKKKKGRNLDLLANLYCFKSSSGLY